MKNLLTFTLLFILVSNFVLADGGKKYGKELSLNESTKVSEILTNPENFVGKKVLIEGTVVAVCKKAGCWIDIASDKEFEKIRVKVTDGEIVFPMEAKGKTAIVEGELFSVMVTPESCQGEGGEKTCSGKEGDACKAKATEKASKKYLLKGIGAVIN